MSARSSPFQCFLSGCSVRQHLRVGSAGISKGPARAGRETHRVPEYGSTMSLWIRGILSDIHGVDWSGTQWISRPGAARHAPAASAENGGGARRSCQRLTSSLRWPEAKLSAVLGSVDRRTLAESLGVRRLFDDYFERRTRELTIRPATEESLFSRIRWVRMIGTGSVVSVASSRTRRDAIRELDRRLRCQAAGASRLSTGWPVGSDPPLPGRTSRTRPPDGP